MSDIHTIPGIGKDSLELLEAAGFLTLESLAKAGTRELTQELARANGILQITPSPPVQDDVESWIATARQALGLNQQATAAPDMPVDFEATETVRELLAGAPFAIPLPAKLLIENQLAVADIPPGILLNRCAGDLEIRVTDRKGPRGIPRTSARARARTRGSYVQLAEPASQRLLIDTSRVRSIADMEPSAERVPTAKAPSKGSENDRVALIRAPLEKTNRGRDPRSRWYIRGVLHTHPFSMAFGAIITLIMAVLIAPAVTASALLLLSDLYPSAFSWVSPWLLVLPCALPVVGSLYLVFGARGKCRICNQRQFFPRSCLKNSRAHHIPGLGYIIPVALHMLVFRWFRCTCCGTPVRLKK